MSWEELTIVQNSLQHFATYSCSRGERSKEVKSRKARVFQLPIHRQIADMAPRKGVISLSGYSFGQGGSRASVSFADSNVRMSVVLSTLPVDCRK